MSRDDYWDTLIHSGGEMMEHGLGKTRSSLNKFNYLKYFVDKQINDLKEEKNAKAKLSQEPVFSMYDSICNSLAIYETIKGIMIKDKLWEGE